VCEQRLYEQSLPREFVADDQAIRVMMNIEDKRLTDAIR
jgi:hypothetical protein